MVLSKCTVQVMKRGMIKFRQFIEILNKRVVDA